MPEDFDKCRAAGGSIRTISGPSHLYGLKKGQYKHICVLKGQVHQGETKSVKNSPPPAKEESTKAKGK